MPSTLKARHSVETKKSSMTLKTRKLGNDGKDWAHIQYTLKRLVPSASVPYITSCRPCIGQQGSLTLNLQRNYQPGEAGFRS